MARLPFLANSVIQLGASGGNGKPAADCTRFSPCHPADQVSGVGTVAMRVPSNNTWECLPRCGRGCLPHLLDKTLQRCLTWTFGKGRYQIRTGQTCMSHFLARALPLVSSASFDIRGWQLAFMGA